MDNRPIGIFDSGLGGLTAVRALRRLMPREDLLYFGDTGRLPYGEKSREQLRRMARQDLDYMASFGVKAVLVACGTLSSNAEEVLESAPLPVFGVLKAGVGALAQAGGSAPAAVLATRASVESGSFARAFRALAPGRELISVPCPALVPLIESGHTGPGDPLLAEALEEYLAPVRRAGASALLLGCTHYGLIRRALSARLGEEVALVEASGCAAAELAAFLERQGLTGGQGRETFYASGSPESFAAGAEAFLGRRLEGQVRQAPRMEVQEKC